MKYALLFLSFGLLLSNCSTLEFEQPLPNDGQTVKTLPVNLVGTYQDAEKTNEILKQYQRIEFVPKGKAWNFYLQNFLMAADLDTTKQAFVRNDSLFTIECDTISPKFAFLVKRVGKRYLAPEKLRYHIEPSKGKFVLYNEETGVPTDHKLVLRKQGEVYFFNIKEHKAKFWQTNTLQQTLQGIRLQYLSTPHGGVEDLPFAIRSVPGIAADGTPDTTKVARPSDAELAKYLADPNLVNTQNLIRLIKKR